MLKLKKVILDYRFILFLYILFSAIVSIQSLLLGNKLFNDGHVYTYFNNYVIFRKSFFHLIDNKDLYCSFGLEYWDFFKYSPAFSLLFGIFAIFPDRIGLPLWNLVNAIVLFLGIIYLPQLKSNKTGYILLFILIELFTNIQSQQSNALIAGLIILAFGFLERDKKFPGTLMITLALFIKPFAMAAFIIYLFYPRKLKLAGYTILWIVIFIFLPLLVIDFRQLTELYRNWFALLSNDYIESLGLSVYGWAQACFGMPLSYRKILLIIGTILLFVPLLRIKQYQNFNFRLFILASILMWVVIFNYKAESPTFIIAISGVAIWYFSQARTDINLVLLILAMVFTCLSPTDLFPKAWRDGFITQYAIKAVPCILIWLKLIYDTTFTRYRIDMAA